jgi:putative DNA primase/helicase
VQPYAEAFRWAKEDFLRLRPTTETEEQRQARRRRDDEDRIANQARRAAQDAEDKAKASRRRLQAGGQWQDAGEIWGAPAEAYLLGRGLPADLIRRVCTPDVMRFSRSVHYDRPPFSDHPCLLGKVSGIDGKGVALGRVFLTEDGRKADLADPKLTIGRMEGGAVRLGGLARRIGVAEGMETALGAMALCGGSMPVWACLGTSGLSSWEPPPGIDEVVIYADGDWERERGGRIITPGKDAAEALARRLRSVGMPVEIAMPPRGKDWLDLWNEMKGMIDDAA